MFHNKVVPFVVYEDVAELFEAVQQLALVALVETPEDEEAVGIPGALAWAQDIRAQWNKADMLRALVKTKEPNQNTTPEFIEGPLLGITYPDLDTLALYEAYRKFCDEVSEGQHQELVSGDDFIKRPEKTLAILQGYGLCSAEELTLQSVGELLARVGFWAVCAHMSWIACKAPVINKEEYHEEAAEGACE